MKTEPVVTYAVPIAAGETEIACASVELAAPALPSTNSDMNYALGMASVLPSTVDTADISVPDLDLIKVTFGDSADVRVAGHDCHVCGKSFPSNAAVLAHLRKHSDERRFPCTECEMKFKDGTTLRQHMRRHTGERPYKCVLCDKAFKQQSQLNQHVRLHTGERPYTCSFCQRTFVQRNHVDRHVRTHTGEKPYACSLCAATFVDRSSLNHHARKHGLGPIRPKAGLAGGRIEPRNGGRPQGSFRPHKDAVARAAGDGGTADGCGESVAEAGHCPAPSLAPSLAPSSAPAPALAPTSARSFATAPALAPASVLAPTPVLASAPVLVAVSAAAPALATAPIPAPAPSPASAPALSVPYTDAGSQAR